VVKESLSKIKDRVNHACLKAMVTLENPDPDTARKLGIGLAVGGAVLLTSSAAFAITSPASGSFAYDIYDIGVNKILQGPIGFVGGVGAMVTGAVMAIQQKILPAVACVLGGAAMLKADTLVSSLGAIF